MSDEAARSGPGTGELCRINAGLISKHDATLIAMNGRLERIEQREVIMEANQKEIVEKVGEVREKLFDGYDTKISNTNERVARIETLITEVAKRGGVDENQIENIVTRKMIEKDERDKADTRWIKKHRIELLSIFIAGCTVFMIVMTYVKG